MGFSNPHRVMKQQKSMIKHLTPRSFIKIMNGGDVYYSYLPLKIPKMNPYLPLV